MAAASDVVRLGQRALQRRAAEDLRRLDRPQRASGRACARRPAPSPASLIVSVTGAAAIAASQSSASRPARPPRTSSGRHERARRVVDEHRVAGRRRCSAARTECERCVAAGDADRAGRRVDARAAARRRCARSRHRRSGVDATTRASDGPHSMTNALGPSDPRRSPRPAATTSATATAQWLPRGGGQALGRLVSRSSRCCLGLVLAPSRARTSARRRGSSWRG